MHLVNSHTGAKTLTQVKLAQFHYVKENIHVFIRPTNTLKQLPCSTQNILCHRTGHWGNTILNKIKSFCFHRA